MQPVCRTLVHAVRVRIASALLMTLAVLAGCGASPEDASQCRRHFAEQRQLLDKKDNPGRKDFTPKLTARWDKLHADFGRLARSATAQDCPDQLKTMTTQVKRVESVLHKLADYDVARMARAAEADLEHAEQLRGGSPDYMLITTYRTLQESATAAQKSLAPFVERVDAINPDDYSALAPAMVALYNAAASDTAFADFKDAWQTIKDYRPPQE